MITHVDAETREQDTSAGDSDKLWHMPVARDLWKRPDQPWTTLCGIKKSGYKELSLASELTAMERCQVCESLWRMNDNERW